MAIETFLSGAYTGTYNSVAIGLTRDGYRLRYSMSQQAIDRSDGFADSLLDGVWRGGRVTVSFTTLSYAKGIAVVWPWSSALYILSETASPIGRLASDVAKSLVLTSTAGTPAATTPATLTATKAIVPPNFDTEILYDSSLREVPIQLALLPVNSAGTVSWATTT